MLSVVSSGSHHQAQFQSRQATDDMESKLIGELWGYPQAGREQCRIATHQDRNQSGHKTRSRQFPRKKIGKHGPRLSLTSKNFDVSRGTRVGSELRN